MQRVPHGCPKHIYEALLAGTWPKELDDRRRSELGNVPTLPLEADHVHGLGALPVHPPPESPAAILEQEGLDDGSDASVPIHCCHGCDCDADA